MDKGKRKVISSVFSRITDLSRDAKKRSVWSVADSLIVALATLCAWGTVTTFRMGAENGGMYVVAFLLLLLAIPFVFFALITVLYDVVILVSSIVSLAKKNEVGKNVFSLIFSLLYVGVVFFAVVILAGLA